MYPPYWFLIPLANLVLSSNINPKEIVLTRDLQIFPRGDSPPHKRLKTSSTSARSGGVGSSPSPVSSSSKTSGHKSSSSRTRSGQSTSSSSRTRSPTPGNAPAIAPQPAQGPHRIPFPSRTRFNPSRERSVGPSWRPANQLRQSVQLTDKSRSPSPARTATSSETGDPPDPRLHSDDHKSPSPRRSGRSRSPRSRSPTDEFPSNGRGYTTTGSPSSAGSGRLGGGSFGVTSRITDPTVIRTSYAGQRAQSNFPNGAPPGLDTRIGGVLLPHPEKRVHVWHNPNLPLPNQVALRALSHGGKSSVKASDVGMAKLTVDARRSNEGGTISIARNSPPYAVQESEQVRPGHKTSMYRFIEPGTHARAEIDGKGNAKITTKKFRPEGESSSDWGIDQE